MEGEYETIAIPNLMKFVTNCFMAVNVPLNHSQAMAASIVESDSIGRAGYGLFMLENCILDVRSGVIDSSAVPKIEKETPAAAWVNGLNGLGPIVANFCVKLAIQKAKEVGAAIVVAKHSNSFGAASRYSKLALGEGLLGWACSNSEPAVVPCRAKDAIIGANQLSVGAPGLLGDHFLLDMSTSVHSPNTIAIKGCSGQFIRNGCAINAAGLSETDASVASKTKYFLPLGSEEGRGSYKGTGLSLMIDILCGVLGGSYYGNEVGLVRSHNLHRRANVSHCFIVVDPKRFSPEFDCKLSELMNHLRKLDPIDPSKPVRVAGDFGREVFQKVSECGEIQYPNYVIQSIKNVAKILKIECVKFVPKPALVVLTSSQELGLRLEAEQKAKILEEEEEVEEVLSVYSMVDEAADKVSMYSVYEADEDSMDWMLT